MTKITEKINRRPFVRHLVIAFCALVAFVFVLSVLLGIFTRHNTHRTVPDFRGMQIGKVDRAARKASMRIFVVDSLFLPAYEPGVVLEQVPAPGAKVKAGRRVFLTINSAHRKRVKIPYVTGFSLRQAKNNIEMAGLEIEKLIYRGDIATNNVLEERYDKTVITPQTDMEIEVGQGITLVVGLGPGAPAQAVPRVVGFSLKEAKSRIWEVGLNVGKVEFDDDINLLNQTQAKVCRQTPDYPQRVGYGAAVNIRLTLDQTKIDRGIDRSDAVARKVVQDEEQQDEADSKDDHPTGKP